jgi:hypothetical protein
MSKSHFANEGHGNAGAEHVQNCGPAPKWAALIGDRLFPMPRRKLTARDILDQSGHGQDVVLVRDHETRNDVPFADGTEVDLAEGNVFRVVARCEAIPQAPCSGAAKLAFVCDDAWEVTLAEAQTERSLKRLFGLTDDAELFRDYESPNDKPIGDSETVGFKDGPVFTAKRGEGYCINIEGTKHSWPKPTITAAEIRTLGKLPADQQVVCEDAEGRERTLREDEVVTLEPCCRFGRAPKYKRG